MVVRRLFSDRCVCSSERAAAGTEPERTTQAMSADFTHAGYVWLSGPNVSVGTAHVLTAWIALSLGVPNATPVATRLPGAVGSFQAMA